MTGLRRTVQLIQQIGHHMTSYRIEPIRRMSRSCFLRFAYWAPRKVWLHLRIWLLRRIRCRPGRDKWRSVSVRPAVERGRIQWRRLRRFSPDGRSRWHLARPSPPRRTRTAFPFPICPIIETKQKRGRKCVRKSFIISHQHDNSLRHPELLPMQCRKSCHRRSRLLARWMLRRNCSMLDRCCCSRNCQSLLLLRFHRRNCSPKRRQVSLAAAGIRRLVLRMMAVDNLPPPRLLLMPTEIGRNSPSLKIAVVGRRSSAAVAASWWSVAIFSTVFACRNCRPAVRSRWIERWPRPLRPATFRKAGRTKKQIEMNYDE